MRCYKILTVVVDENDRLIVLLGRRSDDVIVVSEGDYFRFVFVKKKKYLRVRDVLGKECITPEELQRLAKKIAGNVAEALRKRV
ncbi:MAG: hypothetical protein DRO40_12815 [Thermoprotei archaeon]|nr:MAG: hypothetical protein DRO40_12815 [Thermoprotei archaeon]